MALRTVREAPVAGRRVLVRVDFNVPLDDRLQVADDRRIVEALPTLRYLRDHHARTVLMSHLGRPGGRPDPRLSLRPAAERLAAHLGAPVPLVPTCVGAAARRASEALRDGEMVLLENLRFEPGEERNDAAMARELAALGDLFVEEAFGSVHRAHASTVGVAGILPAYAGFLVAREVEELRRLTRDPERPFVALLGGAKVKDKLPLLRHLRARADTLLLGGAMAFPFLRELGGELGGQPSEPGVAPEVRALLDAPASEGGTVRLPLDFIVQNVRTGEVSEAPALHIPPEHRALDIGPRTRELFQQHLRNARTLFFNGPMGRIEDPRFAAGTRELLAPLRGLPGVRIAAGGDSARALSDLGVQDAFTYISTGGGAALELLEGRSLPGLAVLPEA